MGFVSRVHLPVSGEVVFSGEGHATQITLEGFDAGVRYAVFLQVAAFGEHFAAVLVCARVYHF